MQDGPAPRFVSALYVLPTTIYRTLGLDCWPEERDARQFDGPGPIIAHPPCGHWNRHHRRTKQPGKDCGPLAIEQVRKFGGVLEQPHGSQLFTAHGIEPRHRELDLWGGLCLDLAQGHYAHLAHKRTWLYITHLDQPPAILPPEPAASYRRLESLSHRQRNATPLRFALLLLAICSQVR